MDVVLGVAVMGQVARLALVGSAAERQEVIDRSVVGLDANPVETLVETVVGTDRLLANENHRLIATRLCWSDLDKADELLQALDNSGLWNVEVLSESQAAAALLGPEHTGSAVLLVGDETATLSVVGAADALPTVLATVPVEGSDATSTFATLMSRFGDQGDAPRDVFLVGTSSELTTGFVGQLRAESIMHVDIPDDPTFALARGAAMAAGAVSVTMAQAVVPARDATAYMQPVDPSQSVGEDSQLAYSQAGDDELSPVEPMDGYGDDYDDYEDDEAETGPARLSGRSLLISNFVVAFAVVGFASLAVAVVITIRPTAASAPVEGHQNAQPGKFLPLLPTEQQAPVPPPPLNAPNAGFQGGTIPAIQGVVPRQGTPPADGTPVAPAPVVPPAPGTVPVPIIIPFPGWQPGRPTIPTELPMTPVVVTPVVPSPVVVTPVVPSPVVVTPVVPSPVVPSPETVAPKSAQQQPAQPLAPEPVPPQQSVVPVPGLPSSDSGGSGSGSERSGGSGAGA